MKNLKSFFMGLPLVILPMLSWASGQWTPGMVTVGWQMNGTIRVGVSMVGMYSVRFNPDAAFGRIAMAIDPGSGVSFSGNDSRDNLGFFCYIPFSSPLYAKAEKIALSLQDGSALIVSRTSPTVSTCSGVQLQSSSEYLN